MSTEPLREQEVLDVLHAIERGEVTIPVGQQDAASERYLGNVEFICSNDWRFVIFDRCHEWRYIVEVTAPDGRSLNHETMHRTMPTLADYRPPAALSIDQWGIPTPLWDDSME
ncbi:hypothetical protein [Comamonas sp. JC664]|uniref:DUF7693 family protein n=1 Tax=Comamonas sp. JC664 TaxID=2801917 RepID=UPI00174B7978|nr:hypothetical protein [Comamonas sp. JC664]MBL0696883.1 hypothetical protein [Comamonas sp. JC664]GHG81291.1 hypothetical protein GCM10012319_34400 [Comamonas sp. KCTC 72670]